jgi:hypothetical protein
MIFRYDSKLKPLGQNVMKPPAAAAELLNDTATVWMIGASEPKAASAIAAIRQTFHARADNERSRTIFR